MLVDADTTGTALFTMLFTYLFIRSENSSRDFIRTRIFMAIVIALAFLSKEVTPFFLFAGLFTYRVLNREFKKMILEVLLVFVLGVLIAWTIWWIYTLFTGIDPLVFIKYTLVKKTNRVLTVDFFMRVFHRLDVIARWPVYWMGAPFYFLLLAAIGSRLTHFFKNRKLSPVDFCLITGMGVWIPFLLIKPSIDMMKYQHPIYPLLFLSILMMSYAWLKPHQEAIADVLSRVHWKILAVITLLIVLGVHYYRVGDYLIQLWKPLDWPPMTRFMKHYYFPIVLAGVLTLAFTAMKRRNLGAALLIFSYLFLFPINAGLAWNQRAEYTTAESWMNYGEKGLRETVEYLRPRMNPEMMISARVDIQYYLDEYHGIPFKGSQSFRRIFDPVHVRESIPRFATGEIGYFVMDPVSRIGFTEDYLQKPFEFMMKHYVYETRFGDFQIFRHRNIPPVDA
jgi:hypothetical protein